MGLGCHKGDITLLPPYVFLKQGRCDEVQAKPGCGRVQHNSGSGGLGHILSLSLCPGNEL